MPPLSEVDRARLLPNGDIEIRLVLRQSLKDEQLVIQAIVTQNAPDGPTDRALAHASYVFTPPQDGASAVFTVQRDPASRPFDPKVGIEVRATATYPCWSSLDGAGPPSTAQGWTWELGDWG